ncbi:MAG: hypothetical protein NTV34_21730 [Proteobacteria bacterium]|nr:hypothetical protein [Pseudomonadota bacterium]
MNMLIRRWQNATAALSILFCAVVATCSELSYSQVVKIRSRLCSTTSLQLITSSHVVYHGGQADDLCHEMLDPVSREWVRLPQPRVNTLLGVAAFSLEQNDVRNFLTPIDGGPSQDQDPMAGEAVRVEGFPLTSFDPTSTVGSVVSTQSERILLPLVRFSYEVEGAHSEYGMSGGALLSFDRSHYLGLLSHQYLSIRPGKQAEVHSVEDKLVSDAGYLQESKLLALVIPFSAIRAWLEQQAITITPPKANLEFKETLNDQLKGSPSLIIGSVQFRSSNCKGTGGVGGHGVGVGGAGGHGVGVGGGDRAETGFQTSSESCRIEISKVPGNLQNCLTWPFSETSSWFAMLQTKLGDKDLLTFTDMFKDQTKLPVSGLYQALSLMNKGFRPRIVGWNAQSSHKLLVETALATQAVVAKMRERYQSDQSNEEVTMLLRELEMFTQAIRDEDFAFIDTRRVRRVIKVGDRSLYEKAWTILFNDVFSDSVFLVQKISTLCEAVDRVTI